ncbi:unnamed protein product [Urochloa humidicola]
MGTSYYLPPFCFDPFILSGHSCQKKIWVKGYLLQWFLSSHHDVSCEPPATAYLIKFEPRLTRKRHDFTGKN